MIIKILPKTITTILILKVLPLVVV